MRAGALRHRITLQKRDATLDDFGQLNPTWLDMATLWAEVEPLSGMEKQHAMQVNADITLRVTVRYHPVFSNPSAADSWRILHKGRILKVHYLHNEDERSRLVFIYVGEGISDGQ